MKRRVMIIGPEGSGKSYLAHLLEGSEAPLGKRQDPIYGSCTIDVPAAYLEHRWMAHHLIAMAQNQAACLVLLADIERNRQVYSHGFAKLFSCPAYGVVNLKDHKGKMLILAVPSLLRQVLIKFLWLILLSEKACKCF